MSNIFEGLDYFIEYRHNDCYVEIFGQPKQYACSLNYGTLRLALVIMMNLDKEYEECCNEILNIIAPTFKELEWKIIDNTDDLKSSLNNMLDIVFKELVDKYPYNVKQATLWVNFRKEQL